MKERIVIKLGGSSLNNPQTVQQLAALIRGCQRRRCRVVIVHGGGPAINAELTNQGIQWQFINGQRQTTPEMMSVIDDVLAKKVNGALVEGLRKEKIVAVGLSAADDQILFCSRANEELMQVGKVENVKPDSIIHLLAQFGAKVPVVAPIGTDASGQKYNVNADWAATQIAMALNAKKLIFLTDQNGILGHEKVLVPKATPQMIDQLIEDGIISGGMFTKVNAMMTALKAGVKQVRVLNASVASFALSSANIGTILTNVNSNVSLRAQHSRGVLNGRAS